MIWALTSNDVSPPSPTKQTRPQGGTVQGLLADLGDAGGLQSAVRPEAVRHFGDNFHRIGISGVDRLLRAELPAQLQPLRDDVHGQHFRTHGRGKQGGAEADRPLAEDSDRIRARQGKPLQGVERGAGATSECGAFVEAKLLGKRDAGVVGRQQEVRVGAVLVASVNLMADQAHLGIADAAHLARAAPGVVVHHHTVADLDAVDIGARLGDDAAGLVAPDLEVGRVTLDLYRGPVCPLLGAAKARCLDRNDNLARARRWLRQIPDLEPPVTQIENASHRE